MIDKAYKGMLLCKILEMPKKQRLSYENAINIFSDRMFEALKAKDYGVKPGQSGWYPSHFVEYISYLGFHIELSGDEIESFPVIEVRA